MRVLLLPSYTTPAAAGGAPQFTTGSTAPASTVFSAAMSSSVSASRGAGKNDDPDSAEMRSPQALQTLTAVLICYITARDLAKGARPRSGSSTASGDLSSRLHGHGPNPTAVASGGHGSGSARYHSGAGPTPAPGRVTDQGPSASRRLLDSVQVLRALSEEATREVVGQIFRDTLVNVVSSKRSAARLFSLTGSSVLPFRAQAEVSTLHSFEDWTCDPRIPGTCRSSMVLCSR